jgi:hypothetical protein
MYGLPSYLIRESVSHRIRSLSLAIDTVYLFLVLRKCLVLLEELRDIGLADYFEHGDPLDSHSGGRSVQRMTGGVLW